MSLISALVAAQIYRSQLVTHHSCLSLFLLSSPLVLLRETPLGLVSRRRVGLLSTRSPGESTPLAGRVKTERSGVVVSGACVTAVWSRWRDHCEHARSQSLSLALSFSVCLPRASCSLPFDLSILSPLPFAMSAPRFGGGGAKCQRCEKTVYQSGQPAAQPQRSDTRQQQQRPEAAAAEGTEGRPGRKREDEQITQRNGFSPMT
jgi:hypothetical protein